MRHIDGEHLDQAVTEYLNACGSNHTIQHLL